MSLFPMCKYRSSCSDPLIHLAMHCPSEFSGINPLKDISIACMDKSLIRFSDKLANLAFTGLELRNKLKSHHVLFLRAYAFGVSIEYLANLFMLNDASVIDYMRQGVKSLLESKKFVLWCMHLDISKLKSLSLSKHNIDKGILHKLKFRAKVLENPCLYPEEFFSFLTESPNVLTLCRSGVIRKKTLRVSPPFRIGHTLLQDDHG